MSLLLNKPYIPSLSVVAYWSAQAFSCRLLLTTDARVRSEDTPCGNVRAKSGTGTGLTPEYLGFPVSTILPHLASHSVVKQRIYRLPTLQQTQSLSIRLNVCVCVRARVRARIKCSREF